MKGRESDMRRQPSAEVQVERLAWTPELVDRFWSGFAQTRLTEFDFARQAGKSLMVAVKHHLPINGRILDFGAGNGELVELLLGRGYKVAAYEPSAGRTSDLLDRLGSRDGFLGVIGTESDGAFDVVLMIEVIEHILDQEFNQTLRRVHDLLKVGGTLILTTPNNEDLELGMAYCPVSNMLFHRWQHVRSFTAESLATLLSRYGISPVVVHCLDFRPEFYLPFDPDWAGEQFDSNTPSHLVAIQSDVAVHMGTESNLLFIGRRSAPTLRETHAE
jgi:2-polyprenyl-3-methyl-5-hydroxy-6-metoxy-1,4-benzoquinol methylase